VIIIFFSSGFIVGLETNDGLAGLDQDSGRLGDSADLVGNVQVVDSALQAATLAPRQCPPIDQQLIMNSI
jgi:hypothetical protein